MHRKEVFRVDKKIALLSEFEFFATNKEELLKKYYGKFIVIKDQKVQGKYNSIEEAIVSGMKSFELGTFLVKQCIPGSDEQTFHSRVCFDENASVL
ncbi:MAG: hypothetical protein JEZ05_00335 [Tenericutes bacterium]|nr:hypothetical protein [Mycoplasmatota bacterium]